MTNKARTGWFLLGLGPVLAFAGIVALMGTEEEPLDPQPVEPAVPVSSPEEIESPEQPEPEPAPKEKKPLDPEAAASISGRIVNLETGRGIAGATIELLPYPHMKNAMDAGITEAVANAEGVFEADVLAPGTYRVRYANLSEYPDQKQWEDGRRVAVVPGQQITGIDFALAQGMAVTGKAVDGNGKPLADVEVLAYSENPGIWDTVKSKADGTFSAYGFRPDLQVEFRANLKGYGQTLRTLHVNDGNMTSVELVMAPEGKISGLVVDHEGKPMPGATMAATTAYPAPFIEKTADEKGHVVFDRLAAGKYEISYKKNATFSVYDLDLQTIQLTAGQHRDGLRFEVPASETTGPSISGRVTNTAGEPIPGVRVGASSSIREQFETKTNKNGRYTISHVTQEQYPIRFAAPNYVDDTLYKVQRGSTTADITLQAVGDVSGQIFGPNDETVSDFKILVVNDYYSPEKEIEFEHIHDTNGRFHVTGVFPGEPKLMIRADGYADRLVPIHGVQSGETLTDVNVRLESEYRLVGTVVDDTGQPMPNVTIFEERVPDSMEDRRGHRHWTTDGEGKFEIGGRTEGGVVIATDMYGFVSQTLPVRMAGPLTNVRITLKEGATIEGTVISNGKPVANAQIYGSVLPADGVSGYGEFHLTTNSEGRFIQRGLPDGSGEINVDFMEGNSSRNAERHFKTTLGRTTIVDIEFAARTAVVEGYLMENKDTPGSGTVMLMSSGGSEREMYDKEVGSNGYYRFENLSPGSYALMVRPAGGQLTTGSRPQRTYVDVKANETVRHDIQLSQGANVTCILENVADGEMVMLRLVQGEVKTAKEMSLKDYAQQTMQFLQMKPTERGQSMFLAVPNGTYTMSAMTFGEGDNPDDARVNTVWKIFTVDGQSEMEVKVQF